MTYYLIRQSRINKFTLSEGYDVNKIQIAIKVSENENKKVGLNNVGEIVLPSINFGVRSLRNVEGYYYADKSKPKELRYVNTMTYYPFGDRSRSEETVDRYQECYPRFYVNPTLIELELVKSDNGMLFVSVILTDEIRENYLKEAINLLLEIYGECIIFKDKITDVKSKQYTRLNWEILPPGENLIEYIHNNADAYEGYFKNFDKRRIDFMTNYNPRTIATGKNGFNGYFSFVFEQYCVLESAKYGNATYIIESDNWETLSQMTKGDLLTNDLIVSKISHTASFEIRIDAEFKRLGIIK